MIGLGWLAIFAVSYRGLPGLAQPVHDDVPLLGFRVPPQSFLGRSEPGSHVLRDDLHKAAGMLLEVFVNPLNLVGPIWPRFGVILPLLLLLVGELSLARRSWSTYLLLVLPIALAIDRLRL